MKLLEQMGKFKTVVIDPPWPITPRIDVPRDLDSRPDTNNGYWRQIPYRRMPLSDIAALPVEAVLDRDAWVFCWTIRRFLPDAFELFRFWRVNYRFTMVWHKSEGVQLPQTPKLNAEFILVGAKGDPRFIETRRFAVANCWGHGRRLAHSEKPDEFYDLLRRVTPKPRLDIVARRRIAGFESWGDEAPEGPALPDHYQEVMLP